MTAQILAAVIFVGMFALIIMDKFERQYVTLGSAALVLVVVFGICMHSWDAIKNALNLGAIFRADFWYGASESASSGVNWSTICIFRKNCASVPEERSAIPLQTEQSSAG